MRRAAAFLLLALAGCIEFVDVSAPSQDGFFAVLSLRAEDRLAGADSLYVEGFARAGRGGFVDDTLRVAGFAVPPTAAGRDAREYAGRLRFGGGPARLRLPLAGGIDPERRDFVVPMAARIGGDTLEVVGGSITLPVDAGGAAEGFGAPPREEWQLHLRRGAAAVLIDTRAPLPPLIIIPASLIPRDTAGTMLVELRVSRTWGESVEGAPRVVVDGASHIEWTVRVEPAPRAGLSPGSGGR